MIRISVSLAFTLLCLIKIAGGQEIASLPQDVPPVIGTAIATAGNNEAWSVKLTVPKVGWQLVGKERPKIDWPRFNVMVEEAALTLEMEYHPATQLSENAQNRVLDLQGQRLSRDEALRRLAKKTAVLVSVSGRLPDPFYLQCTKPDTLIVVPGIPSAPAPDLLPHRIEATVTAQIEANQ